MSDIPGGMSGIVPVFPHPGCNSVHLPNILNTQEPLTKARRKLIRALARKKMRGEHRLFLAEGVRLLDELAPIRDRVEFLYGTAEGLARIGDCVRARPL